MKKSKRILIIVLVFILSVSVLLVVVSDGKRKKNKYQNVKLSNLIVYTCLDSSLDDAIKKISKLYN